MPDTIGQQLKQAREERNLTLKKVTQATHIQAHQIEAMETDDFEALPSPVQARAFLRIYAEFLGLSLEALINRQRTGADAPPVPRAVPTPSPAPSAPAQPTIKDAPGQIQTARPAADHPAAREKVEQPTVLMRRGSRGSKKISGPASPAAQTTVSEPERSSGEAEPALQQEAVKKAPVTAGEDGMFRKGTAVTGSQAIFSAIGQSLRQRRESLSLSLDEIELHTHVRKHYLEALELGNFGHLPSSVQTRGMLNNYAHFLDMDEEALLLHFADGLQAQRLERQPVPGPKPPAPQARPQPATAKPGSLLRYVSMDAVVGVGLVLVLLVFAIWGTGRIIGMRSASTPVPSAQSISDILAAATQADTPTPLLTSEAVSSAILPEASATIIVEAQAAGQGPVQVVVVALEQTFVRVSIDGEVKFNGRINPGTAYPFDGNSRIEVLTGNGAAVSILFNQSDLGPMGSLGQVVDRIYTANAILNPTATSTPTPTITPLHSATPTATTTPTLTPRPGVPVPNPTATRAGQ
jgi:cytoskeleton protein RodZ